MSRSIINTLYIREEEKRKENLQHKTNKSEIELKNSAEYSNSFIKINNSNLSVENTPKIFITESNTSILSHYNVILTRADILSVGSTYNIILILALCNMELDTTEIHCL